MNNKFLLSILVLVCLLAGLTDGCKKDSFNNSPVITTFFTEEFQDVSTLGTAGWVIKDNSADLTMWLQPFGGKGPAPFPAYSFTASPDEYIGVHRSFSDTINYAISSWLITPVLSLKNGDKISFYSRSEDYGIVIQDRMQVLMNASSSADVGNNPNSVGDFTTVLLDINSTQAADGYPVTWTKYQHTFSGISGKIDRRIGFRYFVPNTAKSAGIGIDLFKFEK